MHLFGDEEVLSSSLFSDIYSIGSAVRINLASRCCGCALGSASLFGAMDNSAEADGGNTNVNEDNMEVENSEDHGLHLELSLQRWPRPVRSTHIEGLEDSTCRTWRLQEEHAIGDFQYFKEYRFSSASASGQETALPGSSESDAMRKREADFFGLGRGDMDRDFHKWAKVSHNYE